MSVPEEGKHLFDQLFVLEMANNHMGDIDHGIELIREFGSVCREFPFRFAFKLQYRELDTFIHRAAWKRADLKYVKRFVETRLSRPEFDLLVKEIRANGFHAMATPFDEPSVDLIEAQNVDIIKIASCSFTDWPLLARVVRSDKPIIASTAGATLDDLDKVVSFFSHRDRGFAIMHCVAEYPTPSDRIHLSQIDFLAARYPGVSIGFSTHEDPSTREGLRVEHLDQQWFPFRQNHPLADRTMRLVVFSAVLSMPIPARQRTDYDEYYAELSKYGHPSDSTGSGESDLERERLNGTGDVLSAFLPSTDVRIFERRLGSSGPPHCVQTPKYRAVWRASIHRP